MLGKLRYNFFPKKAFKTHITLQWFEKRHLAHLKIFCEINSVFFCKCFFLISPLFHEKEDKLRKNYHNVEISEFLRENKIQIFIERPILCKL